MSDAKEWVTIKIPEPIRDDARDDPRTYGEIMRAGLDGDDAKAPATPNVDDLAEQIREELDTDAPAFGDVTETLERIEATAREAADAAQRADRKVEELQR